MQNESKDKFDLLKWDVAVYELLTAPLTDLNIFLKDLSKSISVGTREQTGLDTLVVHDLNDVN